MIYDEIKYRSSNLIGAWALQNLALYLPCSVPMLVIRGQTNVVWLVSNFLLCLNMVVILIPSYCHGLSSRRASLMICLVITFDCSYFFTAHNTAYCALYNNNNNNNNKAFKSQTSWGRLELKPSRSNQGSGT